ncbi:hypothetical protein DFH06DRAFT_1337867 [Mycena polygramma]|nr:hypothetical protein DFH06DRAFT_1337867 [Mycena polygramma]
MASSTKNVKLTDFQLTAFRESFPIAAKTQSHALVWGDLTPHQLKVVKQKDRNEKARLRIAKRRADVKDLPSAEQKSYAEKQQAYKANYRAKHRRKLAADLEKRRYQILREKGGPGEVIIARRAARARRENRINREIKQGLRDLDVFAGEESETDVE